MGYTIGYDIAILMTECICQLDSASNALQTEVLQTEHWAQLTSNMKTDQPTVGGPLTR